MTTADRTVIDGLCFGEGPRWHDGALWLSDMHGYRVLRSTLDSEPDLVAELPGDRPSGLGWLPDGRLLVVGMDSCQLLRREADGSLVTHAALSKLANGTVNDMIVAPDGTAYVGDMGSHMGADDDWQPGQIIRVTSDGQASQVANGLSAPNGMILTEDGRTLIVAESRGSRLSAFDVAPDGSLSDRSVFAELPFAQGQPFAAPDGICLDADGAVWVAELFGRRLLRVAEGGAIIDRIEFVGEYPIACVLGGPERRTLLVCLAPDYRRSVLQGRREARVAAIPVPVPGSGLP